MTKHNLIMKYIAQLEVGSKISVRGMAKDFKVSEGTAYRAIKEAESQGLVSMKERFGTVRIEENRRNNADKLSFAEVVHIIDGNVLGGARGLQKTLHKFVIGAMEQDEMKRYIEPGSLLIVGNRNEAHRSALMQGAGVLITGGFGTDSAVTKLADQLDLPVISCSNDTYTVASMINRAIYDNLIKKKIMLVEDIVSMDDKVFGLKSSSTMKQWNQLSEETGYRRFPVVDEWNRVIGMVTSKDVSGAAAEKTIEKLMTRNPITVNLSTSITTAAHIMAREGIDLLPVVDANRKLISTISRERVLKAMQFIQRQPQMGETIDELIWSGFVEERTEQGNLVYKGLLTPQMASHMGMVSEGVLTTIMTKAAFLAMKGDKKADFVLEHLTTYFIKPLQIESEVEIHPHLIEVSRKFGKVDVEVIHQGRLICKAMLTAQVMDQP